MVNIMEVVDSDDLIIIRGVNIFPTQVEEKILEVKELAPHFQIELSRKERLDEKK